MAQGNFPLDNLTFDLITIIYEKSKGLEAYERYLRDAQEDQQVRQALEQIRNEDQQHVKQLQQHLQRCLSKSGASQKAA